MDLEALLARMEIHDVLSRYSRGLDTSDWEVYRSAFTDDAIIDYTSAGAPRLPRDEMAAWLSKGLTGERAIQHLITNIEVDLDGDRAKVRALYFNPIEQPGDAEMTFTGGCYHHDMVRTEQGWKSERLVEETLWWLNRPDASAG
jgi:3-phenylpropionate/cinnamic acid dioxygenase small subunit